MKNGFTFVEIIITMFISVMIFGMLWIIIYSVVLSERKIDRMIDFQSFVTTADIMIFNNISKNFFDIPPATAASLVDPNAQRLKFFSAFTTPEATEIDLDPSIGGLFFRIGPTTPATFLSITIVDSKTSLEATLVFAKRID